MNWHVRGVNISTGVPGGFEGPFVKSVTDILTAMFWDYYYKKKDNEFRHLSGFIQLTSNIIMRTSTKDLMRYQKFNS